MQSREMIAKPGKEFGPKKFAIEIPSESARFLIVYKVLHDSPRLGMRTEVIH
jgi:hypothetical protein